MPYITATAGDSLIINPMLTSNKLDVRPLKVGNTSLTVSVVENSDYKSPSSIRCTVSVKSTPTDPAGIQQVVSNGQASNVWSIGKLFPVQMNGTVGAITINGTYYAQIIGMDHNSSIEGKNSIHLQLPCESSGKGLGFVDNYYGSYPNSSSGFYMNKSASETASTNVGGWKSSYAYNTLMPQFLNSINTEWSNIISFCNKYTDNVGGGKDIASNVSPTTRNIWYLSEYEVFGSIKFSNFTEQSFQRQYTFYKNGGSKIRYKHTANTTTIWWWLASPSVKNTYHFCDVFNGSPDSGGAGGSGGATPCFAVV